MDLVLLPGLDGTGELFAPLLRRLPDWIHPIVVSYPRDVPLGYEQLKPLAARALPPAGRRFAILGESFSGPLAVMLADDRPPGLVGLILCASFVKKPFRTLPAWLRVASVGPIYRLWPPLLQVRSFGADAEVRGLLPLALRAIRSVRPEVIAERVKAIFTVNVEADLRRSTLPLLYLGAQGDYLIRRHNLEGIRRLRPDARVAEIDTLHFLLQLEPQRAADEIARFLEDLRAGATGPGGKQG